MSVQGFGPIPGASHKPPVKVGGKIHTIADYQNPAKKNDGIDRLEQRVNELAQQVEEFRQDREKLDQMAQQETESLRNLSAQFRDVNQGGKKLVNKLIEPIPIFLTFDF